MVVKVGINGFGRIGRLVFRAGAKYPDIQFAGIVALRIGVPSATLVSEPFPSINFLHESKFSA